MSDVTINARDGGTFSAYLATPSSGSGPGLVVIQEIFGVNQVMRDTCDHWAAQGYTAISPDLFWRQEPGIQITDKSEEEWQKAFGLYQGFDEAKGVEDLAATIDFIRKHEANANGKVGSIGFCLGGKLAYLCGTRTDADANVGYYGVGIDNALSEAGDIKRPMMLHIAAEDGFCPKEAQEQIHKALDGHDMVTIYDYEGQDHAFAREGGEHYDKASADAANKRSAEFFKQHLG